MIVISGALVLVALVLLIIGLVSTSLPFVYASIAISVVSFGFLLVGVLQRRNERASEDAAGEPAASAPVGDVEGVTAIIPAGRGASAPGQGLSEDSAAAPVNGNVLVVPGRPRYHVEGCRYLTGKDADEVTVQSAVEDGFTACGVCKPELALAGQAAAQPEPEPEPEPAASVAEPAPLASEPEVELAPDPVVAARRTTRATPTTEPGRTPATRKAPARKAPAPTAPTAPSGRGAASRTAAARPAAATKAPAKKAASVAPAAAPASRKPGTVVVIPDRGKFHTADCRYVRGADDAQELTRATARRQGYDACGVCKP